MNTQIEWKSTEMMDRYMELISRGSRPEIFTHKKTGQCYGYRSLIGGHVHHILPRAMGGIDEADNLVDLSYGDHLLAHYLLSRGTESLEMRLAYKFMVNIENKADDDVDLTDEMIREYALSCEAHRKALSKPVATFEGYLNARSYRFYESRSHLIESLGTHMRCLTLALKSNNSLISKGLSPRPNRIQDTPLYGLVLVEPEWDWTQEYLGLGHAPHVNPKLVRRKGGLHR